MANKTSIISFGVESQLDITNINIRKYPDDEAQNILFSVMNPNKMGNYQPLSSTKKFITDPTFFVSKKIAECQTNYIDFTSDKCEQVDKDQLIIPRDITIQTDEIPQPKPPETISMCIQTDEIPQPKLPDPPETLNMCVQTDITGSFFDNSTPPESPTQDVIKKSTEEPIETLSHSTSEDLQHVSPCANLINESTFDKDNIELPIKQDSEVIPVIDITTLTEHETHDGTFLFTENVETTEIKSDDQLCNFSVENLLSGTCYNKHIDKNIIIPTVRTEYDSLNVYEEHSHRNIIIDNSYQLHTVNLYNGQEMEQKDFYLVTPYAYHAIINTTRGSFCIDSQTSHKKVFYSGEWIILDTLHNNLFPTHINSKIQSEITLQSFGSSVAVDGLGNTCIVGNITAHNSIGSVCIYSCVNNIWTMNKEITCDDNIDQSFFGSSVSIDYSGRVIAVGGSGDNNGIGACWIYHKQPEDSQWSYIKKLVGSDVGSPLAARLSKATTSGPESRCFASENNGKSHQGINVQLTPDGKKLFVCGVGYNNYSGAVWVFNYSDNNWVESQKITISNSKRFGTSISTNHDGSHIIISSFDNIYVFNCGEKYELVASLFKENTVHCIGMNQNCSSVITTILQHGKNTDVYVIAHNQKNNWYASHKLFEECSIKHHEIYSCCASVNGETIIICGIDENNNSVSWCFVKINDNWTMINKHILAETITHEIVSTISAFGHTTIIGLPQIDNYNGECVILS